MKEFETSRFLKEYESLLIDIQNEINDLENLAILIKVVDKDNERFVLFSNIKLFIGAKRF